ncbi:uncharacterized protein PF11_0213-like [Polistes fuscatus]|uniref:uncharacterized protein PF11_0213-like n=1 Tax=Polistes fuscatus TaxID=30207 RepID=UPI001CA8F796|nr:uncharacterized protein PF11_0213-like [Polistes fuscatus]
MYNSAERQSISEKRTLSTRNGLICTSPRDENSNFDFKSSRNDRRKKLLSKCEHLLRDSSSNGNRKPSRECDKSSTLVKNANDIDFSKYWVSGEQFFRTPPKNFNESDECNNKENSATFVQLFGNDDDNDIFRGCRRVSFDHSKLDDTFIIPTQENNDVNKLDMLKDVETSSGRDEDFLQRFELPFYRPELENDNKITNKLVLSKFLRKEEDSKETLDWIIDLEKARKKRSSNNFVNHKLKQNSLRNSLLDSNCAIDTNDFNETNQTSPNKDFRKSNVTEDIQSCCFESLKKGYCKDAVINIRKTNSQSKLSSWMVENISDLDIAKESSLNLTNSTHFIPNTINVYNNYIYLSSEHLKKFFDITKLTKLLRRGARVSHIRRRTFKRADYRRKIHLVTSRQRNHSRKNVCEILAGIKKELSLITRKKSREILPNSIHSISTSKVEETLNELITRCKDYICNNNYREEATTKINGLLRKNINNLQKVLKEERLSLSKKSLKISMEEQDSTFLELKSIKEKEDFQKMRTSKDDDKQKLLSTGKKIIDRRDKVKGLLNDMLLLTDDISVIEDNKENIKKHNIHHQKTSWDNMKRRPSNNRMESTKNRGQNIKLSTIKKENQMENEINVVSKSRMNPSSNVGKNKMINSKKDKTLREKQNCSEKPIVCQYKLLENSNRTKKSTDTISNISFGNKKEKIKNNVGPRLETIQIIKEKKTRRVSPSIYPACRHLDRTKKHNDIRLNRQVNVQPVWKPAGAVKPFVSNPTFLSNEPINSRSQMLFNKDNQIIRRSIANPSEPTVLKRKHFCKDNQRNENLVEERVNDLCELFAKTQISSKGLKSNRNSSNIFLTSVRGKSRELNLTKDKSEPKSRPRISSLTSRNTSQIVFKNERDGKLPMTSNSSTNIPTNIFIKDYEKNEEVKDQILDGLERNDKRKSLMHLLKVPDEFPAIRSSTYQNQETEQSTKKEMKEESSKEKLHSSNEEIIKIDDSNYLLKSVLKSYENLDHHTPIENQSSLTSSTNNSYKTDLSSVSNLMTAVASSKCQVSSLSSSKSKTNMIFNQSIKPNQSAEIDKDSFETLMDNNREENELEELIELNDRFKQDSDVIDNNEKDKTSPNLVSNVLYSSKTNDIEENPLNKLPIDTSLNNNNDTETKSMNLTIIEKLRSNDNESIDHMIDEKKSKISQTISDLRSCCDAFTYIDDVKSNYSEQFYKTIISSSPNKIDLNVSLKDVATKVLSQDQSILLPIQMISILTNEHSYKVMKNNATNLNINLINNCDETDTIVNVESKSIGTSDEEKLNHNDRWVRETVELYCEQPNDNLSKTVDKDQKENTDLPNDRWVEETVELYCEQPNDENECKEDKIKLNKSYELLAKINNGNDNIERSTLSESLTNQLNGIKEQLQSVDIQLNKLQATAIQANDIFYRIGKTTTPYDSNFKDMTVSSNDFSKSSNEKQVKNDDRSYEDLHKSIIEASLSSCHSSKRSSKISEEDFQLLNTDLNKMSDNVDTLQTTSRYSTYFYETVRISEDNSNDNQSKECKERFSTKSNSLSEDSLEKFFEKGESIERDKRLSCEYFNENCNHFYNNLNDFNDKVEDTLDMKIKSFSIENIFCESKPTDYSLSNDESDETNSFVFDSIRNSNNTEEKKVKIISEESQHSIFFNTNNSTRTSQSSALNIRNQDLKMIKYYKKEISSPNLQNEEEECNDFYDLAITREGLLLLIYFTVCSFVYFCLNFSITCETFMK